MDGIGRRRFLGTVATTGSVVGLSGCTGSTEDHTAETDSRVENRAEEVDETEDGNENQEDRIEELESALAEREETIEDLNDAIAEYESELETERRRKIVVQYDDALLLTAEAEDVLDTAFEQLDRKDSLAAARGFAEAAGYFVGARRLFRRARRMSKGQDQLKVSEFCYNGARYCDNMQGAVRRYATGAGHYAQGNPAWARQWIDSATPVEDEAREYDVASLEDVERELEL